MQAKQNAPLDANSAPMMAIIVLGSSEFPSDEALKQAISARLPGASLGAAELPDIFLLNGALCTIGRIDARAPISREDPCFAAAWYWPNAWETIKNHRAHILLSVSGNGSARERAKLLSHLIAATIQTTPSALAVHCATSDALWQASAISQMASGDGITPMLFVSLRIFRKRPSSFGRPPRLSAITHGLHAFGLMEIEVSNFPGDPGALHGTIHNLAGYLIEAGPVLKDGDTFGPDTATKIAVRHVSSEVLKNQKVYRIEY